jgi:hypothetical protein
MAKRSVGALVVVAALGWLPSAVRADEIVHFTNGAEMTVRSHAVEKDMVKLDLGSSSFIAFPMSMVDKIVSAGQDVFLNPALHPANQAVAGSAYTGGAGASSAGGVVADTTVRASGGSVGFVRQPNAKGGAGVMLGEAADALPTAQVDPNAMQTIGSQRRVYKPGFPAAPGGLPQVIIPPSAPKNPTRMSFVAPRVPENPPAPPEGGTPETPAQGDPAPEDPPETP